jgi:hypothetical protein
MGSKMEIQFKDFLNKTVQIIMKKTNAKYEGFLNGIRHDKIHLTHLVIYNWAGGPIVSGGVNQNVRWFNKTSIASIKEISAFGNE